MAPREAGEGGDEATSVSGDEGGGEGRMERTGEERRKGKRGEE